MTFYFIFIFYFTTSDSVRVYIIYKHVICTDTVYLLLELEDFHGRLIEWVIENVLRF